jgi:hypothetical protein
MKKVFIFLVVISCLRTCPINLYNRIQPLLKPDVPLDHNYLNATISCATIHNAFDWWSNKRSLANYLFGNVTIGDIYLTSKLASLEHFKLPGAPFGGVPSQQFIASISHTKLDFYCHEKLYSLETLYYHRFCLNPEDSSILLYAYLPIEHHERTIDYDICQGSLECSIGLSNIDNIKLFFMNYDDIKTFIHKEVFAPKRLCYQPRQYKTYIGDCSLYACYEKLYHRTLLMQAGVFVGLPTGYKPEGRVLWEVGTSNYGVVTKGYVYGAFGSEYNFLNLYANLELGCRWGYKQKMRVPQTKSSKNELTSYPYIYKNHTVTSFYEFDAKVPVFADSIFPVRAHTRFEGSFSIGNIWQDICYQNASLLTEYTVNFYGKQKYQPLCPVQGNKQLNINALSCWDVRQRQDFFVCAFVETSDGKGKAFLGLRKVIGGQNVPISSSIEFGLQAFW